MWVGTTKPPSSVPGARLLADCAGLGTPSKMICETKIEMESLKEERKIAKKGRQEKAGRVLQSTLVFL